MHSRILKESFASDHIFLDISASDQFDLIRKIVTGLEKCGAISDSQTVISEALDREEEMPTGIQSGIALPHARTSSVKKIVLAFARPAPPVDFKSADGIPADLVFFSAIPQKSIDQYLKMTAHLVRLLDRPEVSQKLRNATSNKEILHILELID